MVFNPEVLMIFSEVLTVLDQKCKLEYDSKSTVLKGKHLYYNMLMPTDIKKIGNSLVLLMSLLSKLLLRGNIIDHNHLKVLV
jgi:hypothetical protein